MALPTWAHTRDAPGVRPQPCPPGRRQGRPVVFGVAMGARQGGRLAVRDGRARARDARGGERMDAWVDPVWRPARQRPLLPSPVAARGLGVLARAAPQQALASRGLEALTTPPITRWVGQPWGGQRPGPMGHAHAMAPHPGHGCARHEDCWSIGPEASGAQGHQPDVLHARGHHASGLEPVDAHRCPGSPRP